MIRRSTLAAVLLVGAAAMPLSAQGRAGGGAAPGPTERLDLAALAKIRDEGFNRSKIMEISSWLTDVYGPRLTGSPNMKKAADWTVKTMNSWGIANVHTEVWGPFGHGWQNEGFTAQVVSPNAFPIVA